MKIALLHYHLKTGGVTTVLRQQVEALEKRCDLLMLTGEPPSSPFPAPVVRIPGLGYDSAASCVDSPEGVARAVRDAIHAHWGSGCDILHVHNPTLAKNRHMLRILEVLRGAGVRLLLQIHDFAEDGRPAAYSHEPYPRDCHYGVINSRDYRILRSAGLKPEGLHRMDNMAVPLEMEGVEPFATPRILYPVRALRRKNVGEAILLSRFFPQEIPWAVTLPPNSARDMESHDRWKTYVRERGVDFTFDIGLDRDFRRMVKSAPLLVTTSVTEGFGFSFLEAWSAGKMLWGRALPDICDDFTANGLRLDHLYSRLAIPLQWLDGKALEERWRRTYVNAGRTMGRVIGPDTAQRSFSSLCADERIDFGLLDETAQRHVIDRLLEERPLRESLIRENPFLDALDPAAMDTERIASNQRAVQTAYDKEGYARRLISAYQKSAAHPVRHGIDKSVLRDAFMRPEHFSLLKWGE